MCILLSLGNYIKSLPYAHSINFNKKLLTNKTFSFRDFKLHYKLFAFKETLVSFLLIMKATY
jgi:hypothetical protein